MINGIQELREKHPQEKEFYFPVILSQQSQSCESLKAELKNVEDRLSSLKTKQTRLLRDLDEVRHPNYMLPLPGRPYLIQIYDKQIALSETRRNILEIRSNRDKLTEFVKKKCLDKDSPHNRKSEFAQEILPPIITDSVKKFAWAGALTLAATARYWTTALKLVALGAPRMKLANATVATGVLVYGAYTVCSNGRLEKLHLLRAKKEDGFLS